MKLSRQFTVFGSAIFCVVIFSLYLMLDRGHFDHPKNPHRESSFPQMECCIEQDGTKLKLMGKLVILSFHQQ
uniref:Alpha-mannosidase 2 n=1 Tax=Sphaerodactylus townsendi TaxID=933632 RepID=A0ACB8EQE7_9SAUR